MRQKTKTIRTTRQLLKFLNSTFQKKTLKSFKPPKKKSKKR